MTNINYEFEIFDDLLNDHLSVSKNKIINELEESFDSCQNMIVGEFRKHKNDLQLKDKYEISIAHPLSENYFQNMFIPFEDNLENILSPKIIEELEVNAEEDSKVIIQEKGQIKVVGIATTSSWADFSHDRLIYCYFNNILRNQIAEIKRNLKLQLFPLDDIKIQQYVKRAQRILLNFATDIAINNELSTEELKFVISSEYTEKNKMSMIYIYIVDLISFLEKNFQPYIDPDLQIPFHSDIIHKYGFVDKAKYIKNKLEKCEIDKELKSIIDTPLNKILNLKMENRITYHEINYFSFFLSNLKRRFKEAKEDNFSIDYIVKFMFELDFNPYEMSEYMINLTNERVNSLKDNYQKEIFLNERYKCVSQIRVMALESYDKYTTPLKEAVLSWIESELHFRQALNSKTGVPFKSCNQEGKTKLTLDLSVPQLALVAKILNEVNISSNSTKQDLANWISENIKTRSTDNISRKNLYNQMYNLNTSTISEVKAKIIEMLNLLNNL